MFCDSPSLFIPTVRHFLILQYWQLFRKRLFTGQHPATLQVQYRRFLMLRLKNNLHPSHVFAPQCLPVEWSPHTAQISMSVSSFLRLQRYSTLCTTKMSDLEGASNDLQGLLRSLRIYTCTIYMYVLVWQASLRHMSRVMND